jgi:hypothetical protein
MFRPVTEQLNGTFRFSALDEPNSPNMMEKAFSVVNKVGRKIKRFAKSKYEGVTGQELAESSDPMQHYFNHTNKLATRLRGKKKEVKLSHDIEDPMEKAYDRLDRLKDKIDKDNHRAEDEDFEDYAKKKVLKSTIKQVAYAAARSRL